jgi:hypothetical protein
VEVGGDVPVPDQHHQHHQLSRTSDQDENRRLDEATRKKKNETHAITTTQAKKKKRLTDVLIPYPSFPSLTICPRYLSFRKSSNVERSQAIKPNRHSEKKNSPSKNPIKSKTFLLCVCTLKRPIRRDWLVSRPSISHNARRVLGY